MSDLIIPKHLGLIVDGNRRWAKARNLSPLYGHEVGIRDVLPGIINQAHRVGVEEVSAWIFSTENWDRSDEEVDHLMQLFIKFTERLLDRAKEDSIEVKHVGRKDRIPSLLVESLIRLEKATLGLPKRLNLCIDFGGRDEIATAVRGIVKNCVSEENIDEGLIGDYVNKYNGFRFSPDLIIRTGGAQRTSGFMVWEAAYAELAFEESYFPDFTQDLLMKWLSEYSSRERRFGK